MTKLLPELRALPRNVQLDGEVVALDDEGVPDFHRLGARLLHGREGIAATYLVFDVLARKGLTATTLTYAERRALLEEL
jgi:bifunctional non-homologous end joining protein LigD